MIVQDYDTESPLPVEPLRLVSQIAHAVTQAQSEELPRILSRIVEAVRVVSGLADGFVTLLDHAFNELYVLESGPGSEPLRRKVSEGSEEPDLRTSFPEAGPSRLSVVPVRESDVLIELPVTAGTRELGLLCIVSRAKLEPSAEARQILETLSSLAALAIDRRRRRRDSMRLRDWLSALREISDAEDLDDIVQLVVLYAVELLNADAGSLFLRVNETSYEMKGSSGVSPECLSRLGSEELRSRLEELAGGGEARRIVFLPDEGDPGELRLLPDVRSSVLVPIHTEERLLGLLLIESREGRHFSADQELLEVLASQAAVSINRVQLLRYREETRQGLLVSANAVAVGQIATSFVHEAKNSLNGMSLTIVNLLEDIGSEPDLKAKNDYTERLSVVLKAMERLDDLSRRLQRFTRQGLRPDKRDAYLNDVVASTLQLLESVLQRKGMRFEERLDPSLSRPASGKGHPILVDEGQIQQVLMNLILNAVAASPERSRVLVETRNHPDQVEVRIIDHGAGISSEAKRKLFAPFFTTKRDGVGLGLFISRLMVEENHGGSIEILATAPNKGTTFSVQLPKRT